MKRIVFMICLLGGWMTCCFAQGIVFCELTLEAACRQADSEGKYVFVDCYTSWCGPCKMMAPAVEELANEQDDVIVGKLNVDFAPDVARASKVMSIPTLILFKNGEAVEKRIGDQSKADLQPLIK